MIFCLIYQNLLILYETKVVADVGKSSILDKI